MMANSSIASADIQLESSNDLGVEVTVLFVRIFTHLGRGVYYLLTPYLLGEQFGEQFSLLTLDFILAQENQFSNQLWCSLAPNICPPTYISSWQGV